ncbi:MAG: hypothetical protein OXF61_08435 [Acidimicrobiaceae bacterium]|uniref:hypothetical protein n=1 Tax=Candidatus Poriferisodalis multihospitum TaxID=2983191 RepID=UPI00137DEA93|nr:hypothetical protein [Candidatus Poriferisodalis multihospitum]MCY3584148.1 hypothetical protein [Acidimicrobiaceae bacterium]MXV87894.1 hypothetical protein [Acidimicrobiales bacterium]MCY3608532.1 hypothetical protein [Acidimicrobiaceae bacterium]MCY3949216.1 hypothetical protein [Acidimicrobiaceae bacterium]MDE0321195.1 hypothetical protein [Acidimicrobiaceae bacterium]
MRSLLQIFGRTVERRAVFSGALVSTGTALVVGVVAGSWVAERTAAAYAVNGLLFGGMIAGGAIAAAKATEHQLLSAVLSSGPVMVLAVVVQLIRRFGSGDAVAPLGLPLVMLLAASLATLGGILAGIAQRRRRSLLDVDKPRRRRP